MLSGNHLSTEIARLNRKHALVRQLNDAKQIADDKATTEQENTQKQLNQLQELKLQQENQSFFARLKRFISFLISPTITAGDLSGTIGFTNGLMFDASKTAAFLGAATKVFFYTVATPLALAAIGAGVLFEMYTTYTDPAIKQRTSRYAANSSLIAVLTVAMCVTVGAIALPVPIALPVLFLALGTIGFRKELYLYKKTLEEIEQEKIALATDEQTLCSAIATVIRETPELLKLPKDKLGEKLHSHPKLQYHAIKMAERKDRIASLELTAKHLKELQPLRKALLFGTTCLLLGGITALFPPLWIVSAAFVFIGALTLLTAIVTIQSVNSAQNEEKLKKITEHAKTEEVTREKDLLIESYDNTPKNNIGYSTVASAKLLTDGTDTDPGTLLKGNLSIPMPTQSNDTKQEPPESHHYQPIPTHASTLTLSNVT